MKTLLLLLVSVAAQAADTKVDAAAAFARLKTLVGEWTAETEMGKARLVYELIAGGTALVERETAEKMPEMLTVYHFDGDRLILTHYCAAGNQPRMLATGFDAKSRELQFRFLDATNLASKDAGHMHDVNIRFVDDRNLITEWQFHENGRVKMTEKAHYTRAK